MANRSEPSMIIEGFLCPECQQDMSTIELLQAHFELVHSTKNKKTNTSLPDNQTDSKSIQASQTIVSSKFLKQFFNSNQNNGFFKSHTDEFKKFRDNTIGRYVIQTNKLLITLDKMISIDPTILSDDSKRENHFKSIVPWISDKDVQLCPNCAKSFGLITRKHHCRLCGAIMCNKCSKFISFKHAKLLTDPDFFIKTQNKPEEFDFKLKRSDSMTSINSYFFKSTQSNSDNSNQKSTSVMEQMHLRLCLNCGLILEKKYNIQKDKIIRPEFASLYDDLHLAITESQRLYPIYVKMAQSLNIGEASFQLGNAEDLRDKLIKLFQKIENKSSHVLKYGMQNSQMNPSKVNVTNDQARLQKNIRFYAINYLRENSFTLPQLPSFEAYEQLRSKRERNLIEQMEKQRKMENRTKMEKKALNMASIDNSNGWVPTIKSDILEGRIANEKKEMLKDEQEALRVQIQLVEGYLNDAKKQKKPEEVTMLQKNLNELLETLANLK